MKTKITNGSDTTLAFRTDEGLVKVRPGETKTVTGLQSSPEVRAEHERNGWTFEDIAPRQARAKKTKAKAETQPAVDEPAES